MHIGNALTHQFKSFGVVEKVQGLLVCQTCLLSKQFDNAGIFALEENRIGLHELQSNGFNESQVLVNYSLGGDAKLIIRFLPAQLVKGLLTCINLLKIKVNCIKDVVIGNAAFNHVILLMWQSFAAGYNIVKPFAIVGRIYFAVDIGHFFRKFKDVQNGWFVTTNETLAVVTRLFLKWSKIKAHAEIKMFARVVNVWLRNYDVRCVEVPHAAFYTPFLFIKSIRSSTMYSRENVCNTS